MLKEPRQRKDVTLAFIFLLDIVAAATAVTVCILFGAASVGQWLLGP